MITLVLTLVLANLAVGLVAPEPVQYEMEADLALAEVTPSTLGHLREDIRKRYADPTDLLNLVMKRHRVSSKLNPAHVRGLIRNWYKIPWATRYEIAQVFQRANLTPFLYLCLTESGCRPNARSHAGAIGLYQIMPRTAQAICKMTPDQLLDPIQNARCSVQVLTRYGAQQDWRWALAKYNGRIRSCPAKNYDQYLGCLWGRRDEDKPMLQESLHFVASFIVHREIGERYLSVPQLVAFAR